MQIEEAFVIPVAKRRGGVLLAVPQGFIPDRELELGMKAAEEAMVGPSRLLTVQGVEEDDSGAEVPSEVELNVMLVDFSTSVLQHLREYDPNVDVQEILSFLVDAPQILPMSSPLLQQALDWMNEEVSGRLQLYSAEEQVPMTPVPPTKKEPKNKRVTTAALADQISELSRTLPTLVQEIQSLKDKQAQFEGSMAHVQGATHEPPPHKQPFPLAKKQANLQEFMKVVGPSPKVKLTPAVAPKAQPMDFNKFDDPNLPVEDLAGAFAQAAQPSMTQAILQQSQAMNTLVAHLVGAQDPLHDLASSSTSALSTKGAGRREKLQQELANRPGGFFLQVAQLALRRVKPMDPLPRTLDDLPKKAIFSKYLEKQGGFAGQKEYAILMWLMAQIGDAMVAKDHVGAQELLALTMVSLEQVSLDGGKWDLAFLLSLQEEPPQSLYSSRASGANPRLRAFAPLCPQPWATTALAFVKEMDVISTRRSETAAPKSAPKTQEERDRVAPKKTRFPKKAKKGRGRTMNRALCSGVLPADGPLSPGNDGNPSLGSGPSVCKADDPDLGLSCEWTSLQSYSFQKWCASLPRTVLSSRTAFSAFLLQSFRITRSDIQAPAKLLFPLPVPKCGIFETLPARCSSRRRRRVDFDRAFHVLIMALNFLHEDFHFVDCAKMAYVPNEAQKAALSNMRGLLKAFGNRAGEIQVPASGRRSTALVAMLSDLSEFFTAKGLSGDAYDIGFDGAGGLPPGEVQADTTRAEELLPYRSLDPSRLKLTGRAQWDPSSYLDDSLWLPFVEPQVLLWTSQFDEKDLPNLDREDPQKVLELAKIWDVNGLLHLSTTPVASEMKPSCLRVFNCYKGPLQDRQIGDKRGRNQIEAYLPGPSRSLPSGHHLTVLEADPSSEKVVVCMSDRKDFYHQLKVTQSKAETNVLWPPLKTSDLIDTKAYQNLTARQKRKPREAAGDYLGDRPLPLLGSKVPEQVYACFNSVVQGDHLGVEIATQGHSNLLKRNGLLCESEEISSTRPFRGARCLQGLIIDDFFSVSIEDARLAQDKPTAARRRFELAKKIYGQEGLVGSSEKDVVDQQVAKVAGAEVDSSDDSRKLGIITVSSPAAKRLALSFLSLRLASKRATTDALHAALEAGHHVWCTGDHSCPFWTGFIVLLTCRWLINLVLVSLVCRDPLHKNLSSCPSLLLWFHLISHLGCFLKFLLRTLQTSKEPLSLRKLTRTSLGLSTGLGGGKVATAECCPGRRLCSRRSTLTGNLRKKLQRLHLQNP